MVTKFFSLLAFFALILAFTACDEEAPVPKPHAYPKVDYPTRAYKPFDANYCQLAFEQPVYANLVRDTTFFDQKAGSDCWFNLEVPQLNATIHCSYYPITNRQRFDELIADAAELANKHNIKASYIEEVQFQNPAQKVYGMIYNIEGPAASPYQFYATDSVRHFLRGALYFRSQARPDSLAPVVAFMKQDVNRLVKTLKWK
jgi:gliding motility-associated lipoprotein GldD